MKKNLYFKFVLRSMHYLQQHLKEQFRVKSQLLKTNKFIFRKEILLMR